MFHSVKNSMLYETRLQCIFSNHISARVQQKICLAVSRRRIIRPIFFNQTVTAARYRHDLLEPFLNE
jgi:hypothetical protein